MEHRIYNLKWAQHKDNLVEAFYSSLLDKTFTDITLVCEGKGIRAHKLVLSSCSLWFKDIILANNYPNLFIKMLNVDLEDLQAVLNYVYTGELFLVRDRMKSIMDLLQMLRVKGVVDLEKEAPKPKVSISDIKKVYVLTSSAQYTLRLLKVYFPVSEFKRVRMGGFPNANANLASSANSYVAHGVIENKRVTMELTIDLPSTPEPSMKEIATAMKETIYGKNKEHVTRATMTSGHLHSSVKDVPSDRQHAGASASGIQEQKLISYLPSEDLFDDDDYIPIPALAYLEKEDIYSDSEDSELIEEEILLLLMKQKIGAL